MAKSKSSAGAQFIRYFGPLLDALRALGGSASGKEAVEQVARELKISDADQNEVMSSGSPRFPNQVAWARFYLSREGLLDSSKGIIITTGTFTAEAQREAARDGAPPIELVDGANLITMLERLEIGLKPVQTYQPDFVFFQEFQKKADA